MTIGRWWVGCKFAWYDLWIGAYWDRERHILFICPLPTLLIFFKRWPRFNLKEEN